MQAAQLSERWQHSIKLKTAPGHYTPNLLVATSVPCDDTLQAQFATATESFHFMLRGGGGISAPLDAVGRLARLCKRYPNVLNVHVNCFRRRVDRAEAEKQFQRLGDCRSITVSSVPGMKGLFWKHALRPHQTDAYDYIWLIDADLDLTDRSFNLVKLMRDMRASNASLAQPRIRELASAGRGTDIRHLRAGEPFPSNCSAVVTDVVEVMAPLFRGEAWHTTHKELISLVPDTVLARTDWGITQTWCGVLRHAAAQRPACALLHESIAHLDEHLIERAGLANLTDTVRKRDWEVARVKALNLDVPGVPVPMDQYFRSIFPQAYGKHRRYVYSAGPCMHFSGPAIRTKERPPTGASRPTSA
jgi:hypothetical protein